MAKKKKKKENSKPHISAYFGCGIELFCLTDPEIKGNVCQKVKAWYSPGCQYSSESDYHFNWNSQYLAVIKSYFIKLFHYRLLWSVNKMLGKADPLISSVFTWGHKPKLLYYR